jgi:Domain of unknown function (DUF7014)/Abortive infection C-terminus
MYKGGSDLSDRIFNVFSRREKIESSSKSKSLSREFRNRVIMLFQDEFQFMFNDFLANLQKRVTYQYGKFKLSKSNINSPPNEDMLQFLVDCEDKHFFDVLEIIFQSGLRGITFPDNALIPRINEFFLIDDLPYYLTGYSTENYSTTFHGSPTTGMRITEFPKVIRKESELIHQNAIEPALTFLNGKEYIQANNEFLNALEDFRKGDFSDCLTKCGSSFESVMKVLCEKNSIPYKKTDTASILLNALLSNGKLDGFWLQPLALIATLRNRFSSSHGAGSEKKNLTEHVAKYVINATASAILFLHDEFS